MRFVLDPQGRLTPDLAAKLPGRGVYAASDREAVTRAAQKGLFARSLKRPAPLPDGMTPEGLATAVESGLLERLKAALGLARRAGKLVAGYEKTSEALRSGRAALAIVATDAGTDAEKIVAAAKDAPVLRVLARATQSAAIGEDWAAYAAVLTGAEAERILREARRLEGFSPVFASSARAPTRRESPGDLIA